MSNILIVEDVALAQKLAKLILEELGHTVHIAETGEKGVDFFKDNHYDFVFMDIGLPGIDGLEATRRIRQTENQADSGRVPIVALTANYDESKKSVCLDAGMDDFMTKPLTKEKAQEVITRFIER